MKKLLDIDNWNRRDHFHFFSQFEEPFWGVTAYVNCDIAFQKSKDINTSFFLYYLHKSIKAVNEIEEFRYRIDADHRVFVYDKINASATINRENGTFGFSYIEYDENYAVFEQTAKTEIDRVKSANTLVPATSSENVIHYSSIPWINFTSLSHARRFSGVDSIPKISFGQIDMTSDKKRMPVSIHVHHGLIDGLQVGQYIERFQSLLDK